MKGRNTKTSGIKQSSRYCRLTNANHMVAGIRVVFLASICLFLTISAAMAQGGRIVKDTFCSSSLAENPLGDSPDREVTIYLPPEYDTHPEIFYPVVYLLHGYTGNEELWIGGSYARDIDIRRLADLWIQLGRIKPMILVMPDSYNKLQGSWYANSSTTGRWGDYIAHDLVKYIDDHYRTLPQKESRAISGHSMGGYGALRISLENPNVFGGAGTMDAELLDYETSLKEDPYVYAIPARKKNVALPWRSRVMLSLLMSVVPNPDNPPFHCDFPWRYDDKGELVRDKTAWDRFIKQDVLYMINQRPEALQKMRCVCILNALDNPGGLAQGRALHETLSNNGVKHLYQEVPGTHASMLMPATQITLETFSDTLTFEKLSDLEPARKITNTWGHIKIHKD